MTKIDHRSQLPVLFKENNLSILPITRGSYMISQFEAYKDFENIEQEIVKVKFPDFIESINYNNITSEAMAINCAYISGIISDFLDDDSILPAVNGRMSSSSFEFSINNTKLNNSISIQVNNSQIEIDGGFEGYESLALIEAKNSISDDFLIRQLYYPYRLWESKISKKIRTIFMVYSNDIFSFYEYDFVEPNNYNSLELIKQKNYIIDQEDIYLSDITEIVEEVEVIEEPEIPFPQADDFKRIINLCELLLIDEKTKEDIYSNYDFDPRQADYYTNAAMYLGLLNKSKNTKLIKYSLSSKGRRIMCQRYRNRQLGFVRVILEHEVFNKVLKRYLSKYENPSKKEIVDIMKLSNIYNVNSEVTFRRRASTVSSWIDWILSVVNS